MTPTTLSRGSLVRIHAPGHHRHGQTGYIASLDVQDEGEPLHLVAIGGVFVALPVSILVPRVAVDSREASSLPVNAAYVWPKTWR